MYIFKDWTKLLLFERLKISFEQQTGSGETHKLSWQNIHNLEAGRKHCPDAPTAAAGKGSGSCVVILESIEIMVPEWFFPGNPSKKSLLVWAPQKLDINIK